MVDCEYQIQDLLPGDVVIGGWYELSLHDPHIVVHTRKHGDEVSLVLRNSVTNTLIDVTQDKDTYVLVRERAK